MKPESGAQQSEGRGSIWLGIGICAAFVFLIMPLVGYLVGLFAPDLALIIPLTIGLTQLIYIVPTIIVLKRKGATATIQGVLIAAGITFLLNGGCWGLVAMSLGNSMH